MEKLRPVRVSEHLTATELETLELFVRESLRALVISHEQRVREKLVEWERLYRGVPREKVRTSPWENASNIVVQVIGQHTDTLAARIMGSIYELDPLWPIKALGVWKDSVAKEHQRAAIEELLTNFALDQNEFDLYRKEQLLFSNTIKYGFGAVKTLWEECKEYVVVGGTYQEQVLYQGPRVDNVAYQDLFASNAYTSLKECPFVAERLYLTAQDLKQRGYTGKFEKAAVSKLLGSSPDDYGYSEQEREASEHTGIDQGQNITPNARWHIYECWFKYFTGNRVVSLLTYYHLKTQTWLGGYFNFLPKNALPYTTARLGYRTNDLYGLGFCELLAHAQEEATAIHNRRNDNGTLANLRMLRVSPKATRIGSNFKIKPFAVLRADRDEIETIQLGDIYPSRFQEEELLLKETADRSGTAPAVAGMGSGTISKKGIYNSAGTFATMQAGNHRVNLDTMDMRYAHTDIGNRIFELIATYQYDASKLARFGEQAQYITQALEAYNAGLLGISVRSATASINKETDRQNDLYLTAVLGRHYNMMATLMQSVLNPAAPAPIQEYLLRVIRSANLLHQKILRNFGYENVTAFVPESEIVKAYEQQQQQQVAAAQQHGAGVPGPVSNGIPLNGGGTPTPTPSGAQGQPPQNGQ